MQPSVPHLYYRNLISVLSEGFQGGGITSKILGDIGSALGLIFHHFLNTHGWSHLLNHQLLPTLNTNFNAGGIIHELTSH